MEQFVVSTAIGRNLEGNTSSSGASTTHNDMIGVAAKFADVLLYPLQNLSLIQQAIVQATSFLDLGTSKKSIQRDTIIEGDHYDIAS